MKTYKCKNHSKLMKYLNELVSAYQQSERLIISIKKAGTKTFGDSFHTKLKVYRMEHNSLKEEIKKVKSDIKIIQRTYELSRKSSVNKEEPTTNDILKDLYFDKYRLNKPQFVAFMTIIKEIMERDLKFTNTVVGALNEHNDGSSENRPYDMLDNLALSEYNDKTVGKLIQWLVSIMGDHSCGDKVSDSWISYYIYETDWGRNFGDSPCVTAEDGSPIPFKTIGDVYDLIVYYKTDK